MSAEAPNQARRGRRQGGNRGLVWGIVALIAAAVVAWIIIAAVDDSAGPEEAVSVSNIADNPEDFFGQQVTLSATVEQVVVQPGAFTLSGTDGGQILVLPTQQVNVPQGEITEGDPVQVTGTVRQVTAQIQEDDDFLFEDDGGAGGGQGEGAGAGGGDEFLQDFDQQPAIVATAIDTSVPEEGDEGGGAFEEQQGQEQQGQEQQGQEQQGLE